MANNRLKIQAWSWTFYAVLITILGLICTIYSATKPNGVDIFGCTINKDMLDLISIVLTILGTFSILVSFNNLLKEVKEILNEFKDVKSELNEVKNYHKACEVRSDSLRLWHRSNCVRNLELNISNMEDYMIHLPFHLAQDSI